MFYAYVHARPNTADASGVFYAGKGLERRARSVVRDNRYHTNIVAKYGKSNILVGKFECSSEDIAFELEKGLIKCLRRMGVTLANVTDGGEGNSGLKLSEEARRKVRLAIDLNLFLNGVFMEGTAAHKELGEWWEQQHPLARWGGRFNDGNHYSFEYEGMK